MMYVKADDESILSYGEEDNDDIRHLCHQICLLLFQGMVLRQFSPLSIATSPVRHISMIP